MDKNFEKDNRYVQFKLGLKTYCLDISCMEEVIEVGEIIEIPDCPSFIKGVTRFRTTVITVMSLKEKMGIGQIDFGNKAKIIVIKHKNEKLGILIDELIGIKTREEIEEEGHGISEIIALEQII